MTVTRIAALLGAADTGAFLAGRPELFRQSRGRAAGSGATLGVWLALAARSPSGSRSQRGALALAAGLVVANTLMLGVHVKHRIVSRRVIAGPLLSWVALLSLLRHR